MKKLLRAVTGILIWASVAQSGWAQATLPSWVGSTAAFNWQPRLGGVYWLDSRAVVKQAAPNLTQSSRPVLVDIKTDATGFGYRFDLNTWDAQSAIHSYYPWNGTDAGTPASPEDALQIFGASSNAQFILNIPIPLNLTSVPTANWGYDGNGYTWQTPQFYAAMVQYLTGAAGPQSEWANLTTNLNFFSQPANFNWADLRAARGHVNPYPIVAFIIGSEPYNIEGTPTGALYGPQAEKFRIAIRAAGYTGSLGLHVHDMGYVDDPTTQWFWPMMTNLTASDFSFMDLEHYYQFSTVLEDFKRTFPVSINPNAAYWMPQATWKSDYTKFLWIVEDTRNAIRDDSTVTGLGASNRWQLGWSEHGIQVTSEFMYNDMFSAMHWAGWLAESMRQNVAWDSAWTLLAEGYSTAQLQVYNGYTTRTPMFFVYQMAQDFYGYNYLTNSYDSPMGSTTNNIGDPVEYPWTSVRVFQDPATGNIHLFVVNQSTNQSATVTGFESWNVIGWKQLTSSSYTNGNPLGVAGPEPIQTQNAVLPAAGASLVIPPISVNHIILSSSSLPVAGTPPTVAVVTPVSGATVSGSIPVTATASGVASVQLQLNGTNLGTALTSSPYSQTLNTATIANGSYTLTAVAVGTTGNQATAPPVTIVVANDTTNQPVSPTNSGLLLQTNGAGSIQHEGWPKNLVVGKKYTVTALPSHGNIFSNWVGGTTQPYAVLSASARFSFVMQPNLALEANFVPNPFTAGAGIYDGLFFDTNNGVSEHSAGMLRGLAVHQNGSYSGTILINGERHVLDGSFGLSGQATNHIARPSSQGGEVLVEMTLNWNVSPLLVTGTVSGTDNGVAWAANLLANPATNNVPSADYTMLIPPATNGAPNLSPGGDGYALITNNATTVKITGALADGTAFNQSTPVAQGGLVPIYANLYAGKGLLLGWINLDLANTNAAATGLTWIRPENASGLYPNGFTSVLGGNQILISPWINSPANTGLLTNLSLLDTINATNALAEIPVTVNNNSISDATVTGSINPRTGFLKVTVGSGASQLTGYGAILPNQTNGGGYYLTKTNAQAITLTR
jgi:hypothetical protein